MATNTYDSVIVGSEITGGWAAKELTEKGLNTLVLEAGRTIVPEKDYVEHVPVYDLKYRGWDNRAERQRTQPIQREVYYACDEYSSKFFVNDLENPYTSAPGKHFYDRMLTIGRAAVLTRVHKGRAACHYCGVCHRGCITGSYFSSLSSTLPAAQKTGRFTIRPYSVVHSLIFDPKTRRVSGVRVIDAQTKGPLEFKARVFFLCASTLESTRILLNSATPEFPNGLANSSA